MGPLSLVAVLSGNKCFRGEMAIYGNGLNVLRFG